MSNRKEGHILCPKAGCNKRGFMKPHIRRSLVQLPNQKNVDTIVKALDYNAKLFYRLHEFTASYLPFDVNFDDKFNINNYQKIVPFSPHTKDEIIEFEDKFKQVLFEKFEKDNKENPKDLEVAITEPKNDVDGRTLHKLRRTIEGKKTKKNVNRLAIACLYCSISFASLKDLYKEMEKTTPWIDEIPISEIEKKADEINKLFSKCLIFPYSSLKYLFDKRHNTPPQNILKLLRDSYDHGYYGASSINSFNRTICKRCAVNGYISLFKNSKCPRCNNSKQKKSKIHPKTIQKMEYSISDNFNHMYSYYLSFLDFMSRLTDEIKNNPDINSHYSAHFKKYEKQIINFEYSYLRDYSYCMFHYDNSKKSKKKCCSLSKIDMLNIIVNDPEYKKIITEGIEKRNTDYVVERLLKILSEYKYPDEFAEQKVSKDILTEAISFNSKDDPHSFKIMDSLRLFYESNYEDILRGF